MKISKNTYIIVALIAILCIQIVGIYSKQMTTTFNFSANSEEELARELIIAMFIEDITLAVNEYYSQYFSSGIEVFSYEIKIKDIHKEDNSIIITFGVPPEIGAHNPVGYDKITYSVDPFGIVTLVSFEHLKSYEIPEHLKDLVIKPLL